MKIAYLFHGFNVKDGGANTIDKLSPYLMSSGIVPVQVDYLWNGLLGVRLCNKKIAKAVSNLISPDSIAIGHSNGCALIHLASHFGAKFNQVVYINPALNRQADLAPQISKAHVWHSPKDRAVGVAKYLPKHIWGNMGAVGAASADPRYVNYNKAEGEIVSTSHSDVFEDGKIEHFGPLIVSKIAG